MLQRKSTGSNRTPKMRSLPLNWTREQRQKPSYRPLVLFYSFQCPEAFAVTHKVNHFFFCIILLQSKYSCHYGCADGLECRRSCPTSPPGGKPRHPHPHRHGKCVRPTPPTEEPGSGDIDEFWTWIGSLRSGWYWGLLVLEFWMEI